jgi:hypothetical protein
MMNVLWQQCPAYRRYSTYMKSSQFIPSWAQHIDIFGEPNTLSQLILLSSIIPLENFVGILPLSSSQLVIVNEICTQNPLGEHLVLVSFKCRYFRFEPCPGTKISRGWGWECIGLKSSSNDSDIHPD